MKTQIPWHLPNTQKSVLLKTKESHFSLVWVMEFSIISSCLGKVKVFPIILACQSQTTFNVCMETVNGFYVSNGVKGLSVSESGCGIDSRCSYLIFLTFRQLQSVDSLKTCICHDMNTQLKKFLWLHTAILNYFICSRVKASQILYDGTLAVTPNQNWVKAISTHLMRKNFLSFKLFTTNTQEKLC